MLFPLSVPSVSSCAKSAFLCVPWVLWWWLRPQGRGRPPGMRSSTPTVPSKRPASRPAFVSRGLW